MKENAPVVSLVYVEPSTTEFRLQKPDGERIPGRVIGRFGFVQTGQTVVLTPEEAASLGGDTRFVTPEDYAKRKGTKSAPPAQDPPPAQDAPPIVPVADKKK